MYFHTFCFCNKALLSELVSNTLFLWCVYPGFFRWLYDRFRLPIAPVYGGFPVKFRTFLGDPIPYDPNINAAELAQKVSKRLLPFTLTAWQCFGLHCKVLDLLRALLCGLSISPCVIYSGYSVGHSNLDVGMDVTTSWSRFFLLRTRRKWNPASEPWLDRCRNTAATTSGQLWPFQCCSKKRKKWNKEKHRPTSAPDNTHVSFYATLCRS